MWCKLWEFSLELLTVKNEDKVIKLVNYSNNRPLTYRIWARSQVLSGSNSDFDLALAHFFSDYIILFCTVMPLMCYTPLVYYWHHLTLTCQRKEIGQEPYSLRNSVNFQICIRSHSMKHIFIDSNAHTHTHTHTHTHIHSRTSPCRQGMEVNLFCT
jgi:hypothetical protein